MADKRRSVGALGERVAGEYLEKRGYEILQTNFRCPLGEIDIVARQDDCLAFVEVRTKSSLAFGTPEESITPAKKAKLIELAESYVQEHGDATASWRIDVVAVQIGKDGKISRIELIRNAIE